MRRTWQGRPTWARVDLDALRWNLRQVRACVGPRVRILAVVKANAYGHGAVVCSRALVDAGADGLGVATVEEGVELRCAGLTAPIVILGLVQPYEAEAVAAHSLEPTLSSLRPARALAQAAVKLKTTLPVQLKIDTGMGRIGVGPAQAPELARQIRALPNLVVKGVFTHFAHADGQDRSLLRSQWRKLQTAAGLIRAQSWPGIQMHAANSAAVMEAPAVHADMVRPGLMLYGLYPAERFRSRIRLKPALAWVSRIVELKTVPARTGLSYGHTFVTRRVSRVATLPVGYADGWSRGLSNCGRVLIRGRACPVVGRVCMDMCLVDVTGVPGAGLGDEAVLIGRQGGRELTADDLARTLGTISYEIVCAIGSRVPRLCAGRTG